ncbi:MAG: hypothetical protein IJI24_03270 [Lachnospiraceae bacterium]|nr:hypothetical protein [Lachnospiraceae bacterium]
MKTVFNFISDDWRRVKNHCRTTDNKDFTEKDATETFKKKLIMSEHSPIRLLEFDWSWPRIAYWLSTEWSRHKFEKFISTQRDDRLKQDIPRGQKPQDTPVNFDGYANMQNLIDAWRKRLCYQATPQARGLAEDFKITLHETHPIEANALVPNCIYRGGCPEFVPCGYYNRFLKWVGENYPQANLSNLQERYDLYNEWFYSLHVMQ